MGINDVLPGIDFDVLAGGMFRAREQYGNLPSTSVESYWIGAGITWRYGRGTLN
jgi:long-chain fatty acid transport protein